MKYLSDYKIENKRVILRCDFNVPVKDGMVLDDNKIVQSLKTIKCLLDNNNKLIILSHFGRVKDEEDKEKNSLYPVYEYLKRMFNIDFVNDASNLNDINFNGVDCYLVENTRFTDIDEKKESANNLELAKYWASFADIFVIDAFASLHRVHSSTAGISKFLPTYFGFLVENEIKGLNELIENKKHPFLVVMGGAKVDDKIKIIESLLKKCDKLILTGGILNTFLAFLNKNVGKSLVSTDEFVLKDVKNILYGYSNKLYFTDDFVINRNGLVIRCSLLDIQDNDIIYDNIVNLKDKFINSQIVFLNGTCGKYEVEEYSEGTIGLLNDFKKYQNVYIGGGDTISAVKKFNLEGNYKYLSSGGGATLEYIAYGKLQAIEWIKENELIIKD